MCVCFVGEGEEVVADGGVDHGGDVLFGDGGVGGEGEDEEPEVVPDVVGVVGVDVAVGDAHLEAYEVEVDEVDVEGVAVGLGAGGDGVDGGGVVIGPADCAHLCEECHAGDGPVVVVGAVDCSAEHDVLGPEEVVVFGGFVEELGGG